MLAWDQAPQCGKKAKNGVKYPCFLLPRLPLGSLRSLIFSPNGESGPGFKYDFISRLPLPRSLASFDKRAGREYPSTLVKIAP